MRSNTPPTVVINNWLDTTFCEAFCGGQGGHGPLQEPIKLFFQRNRGDIIQKKKKIISRLCTEKEH